MKALIVYAHPNKESFTKSLVNVLLEALIENDHSVEIRDLYSLNFNPVLSESDLELLDKGIAPKDIKIEQDYITWCDTIFFVFPTWWESMPAIMRGYVDRVFSYGFAYGSGESGSTGLLKGKKGVIVQGAGASKECFEESGLRKSIEIIHNTGIFDFCGIEPSGHFIFNSVTFVSDEERKQMLNEVKDFIKDKF